MDYRARVAAIKASPAAACGAARHRRQPDLGWTHATLQEVAVRAALGRRLNQTANQAAIALQRMILKSHHHPRASAGAKTIADFARRRCRYSQVGQNPMHKKCTEGAVASKAALPAS